MSGGGTEAPSGGESAPTPAAVPAGGKKRDSQGPASSPVHLIIKDLGEIHSRLLDHRPIIQGETRYFVKEFEEKRGLREVRVLENLKNVIQETNEQILPKCRETMQDHLSQTLQRLQAASHLVHKLQQKEQEQRKEQCSTPHFLKEWSWKAIIYSQNRLKQQFLIFFSNSLTSPRIRKK
ncbi:biogenesis of lysosome-related organelles complex 1 subunit 5 isoform X2 [Phascolarctos cinereus]|uniref:Biogenesis of lysosome-related organelles complex 1 subunit 5 n=1 Tax=Phascolarctos cinereus TaxID=38626 RepID=A0A6P5M6M7_PHACI|nr:biogenesis of lysosome-related organelles complex 1 subunit 5 isoform X2 [Phascolarctos cinereus]